MTPTDYYIHGFSLREGVIKTLDCSRSNLQYAAGAGIVSEDTKISGMFASDKNIVGVGNFGGYVMAQELFHAFPKADFMKKVLPYHSTIETEGDIMAVYVMLNSESGEVYPSYGE